MRPEGNLLLEVGFLKRSPPEGEIGSICYMLALPYDNSLMLWAFGLFYGTPMKDGVYLNRYQFCPIWLPAETIHGPTWKSDMIPAEKVPPLPRIPFDLTVAVIRRIANYEEWGLARCGLEYRCTVLYEWEQFPGQLPPQEFSHAWHMLADAIKS